ncbi:hypothetical protein B0H17DRAFT_1156133 [Mycena rosella]|uniref:P-type ATPase A domain-containing protein n=1 Tax=Mycena rosella TaxID=1033263 RepID=A0AAD7MA74_MYCRO|nr:hypothetical protein B0H17DRAFT_1156133 [Mycena rosella]
MNPADDVDLSRAPLTDRYEAARRLQLFGPNAFRCETAGGKRRPPDWSTFLGIIIILCLNAATGVYAECRTFGAVSTLMQSTSVASATVKHADLWIQINAPQLVRGDIIALTFEDTVPADCRVIHEIGSLYFEDGHRRRVGDQRGTTLGASPTNYSATSLHGIVAQVVAFCLAVLVIFLVAEVLAVYAGFHYTYHRGINAIFVLLIGSIPITLPTVLSVVLSLDVDELVQHSVLFTRVAAVEELARVTVMCLDKSVLVEGETVSGARVYGPFGADEYFGGLAAGHPDIEIAHYRPLCYVDGPIIATYRTKGSTQLKRVTKGMGGHVVEMCMRNRTPAIEDALEADIEDCSSRNSSDSARQAVSEIFAMGIQVEMTTDCQLAIAKEVGRRVGLGDNMFSSRVPRDGPPIHTQYSTLDELILDTAVTLSYLSFFQGHGMKNAHALSTANVSIIVGGPTPNIVLHASADLTMTRPDVSTVVDAVRVSRQLSSTNSPFMVILVALTTNTAILSLSMDHPVPSIKPGRWDLTEIFSHRRSTGCIWLFRRPVIFAVVLKTGSFERTFGLSLTSSAPYDNQLHTLVYLQITLISHALIFIVRSERLFFRHWPSTALLGAFCAGQISASVIAAYGNLGFARMRAVGAGWIGLVWVWNIIWFVPIDFIKFGVDVALRARRRYLRLLA